MSKEQFDDETLDEIPDSCIIDDLILSLKEGSFRKNLIKTTGVTKKQLEDILDAVEEIATSMVYGTEDEEDDWDEDYEDEEEDDDDVDEDND